MKIGALSSSLKVGASATTVKWWRLGGKHTIRLEVEGILEHRDVALRVVSAACRLPFGHSVEERFQDFHSQVVSAVGEAFNNIVIHGYKNMDPGVVEIHVAATQDEFSVELRDFGVSFDPADARPPDLDSLPESGLGVFIMKSFMDRVEYRPGRPNVLRLTKLLARQDEKSR